MKPHQIVALVIFAVAVAHPLLSSAGTSHGNDGTFCTYKGYLAYDDLEFGEKKGAVTTHLLKIFRFESKRGIYFAGQVSLPKALMVGWMICGADRVALGGHVVRDPWPKKCVVGVASMDKIPAVAQCSYDPTESLAKLGVPQGLSIFGPNAAPIPLESVDPDHSYQLLRHLSDRGAVGGVEWHSNCEIVQLDRRGTILQRLVIYDSRRMEYAD